MNISIVTVCYNDQQGLVRTYRSLKKILDKIQWVVIDGKSIDGTFDFLQAVEHHNFTFISEKDNGIFDAMNKGVKLSTRKYVVFLNAGDVLSDDFDMDLLKQEIENDYDLLFYNAKFVYPNGKSIIRSARKFDAIWHSIPANHQCIFVKTELARKFPYSLDYNICGDFEFLSNLWVYGASYKVIPQIFAFFEVGGVSTIRPLSVLRQAATIQKRILGLPNFLILISAIRRSFSLLLTYIFFRISLFCKN